jgi:hypothetical protein
VYYLSRFRGFHNHPLDWNLQREENTTELLKKRVPGRITLHCENWLMYSCYLQEANGKFMEEQKEMALDKAEGMTKKE